ncbi:transcriptional regulator [Acinetobacter sp. ANC 4654]|uniref:helix-turn-helix domain-containing protein n=1 Tax=Acinetobacter sp. ANC 4654 TaxID=1977872 RepID=UPI000A34FF97|nr:helix-turn-helix transcriptional regulator [Acinetobacter sp. ANC 4654]OTG90599.1 transcriptional regulator [Acinetobacter sp. ANC 4654]
MKKSSSHFLMFGVAELLQHVGQNIRTARIRRNLTILELANRVHVDERTISRLEKGDPSINFKNLVTVLMVLGLEDSVFDIADPNADELGRALELKKYPKRVRKMDQLSDDF